MFKSEIRDSELNELREKVSKRSYGKYLTRVKMVRLRGFDDQTVSFDFPVTALVGPNGGGKTTILGAAGCIYQAVKPRLFFAKSGKFDDSMKNWTIEYELVDKAINAKDTLRRTVGFRKTKWNRDNVDRDVLVFGVSRTVPANERRELRKCASGSFTVAADQITTLSAVVASAVSKILGKDVSKYTKIKLDSKGKVSLLSGETEDGAHFSEFHFGAGESSVIKMVTDIEAAPDNALVLIEEIENGLHPIATVRMVEFLVTAAQRKKCQVVFTTHSDDALLPLPPLAVWSALDHTVIQGKPDIRALRTIRPSVSAEVVIFVEDMFSQAWLKALLRAAKIEPGAAEVYPMAGDDTAVTFTIYHNDNPAVRSVAACFIDGDSQQSDDPAKYIYRLPGQNPESFIYDRVLEKLDTALARLTVALLQKVDQQADVAKTIKKIKTTNSDAHLLYVQLREALGFLSETTVRDAFITAWIQEYPEEAAALCTPLSVDFASPAASMSRRLLRVA